MGGCDMNNMMNLPTVLAANGMSFSERASEAVTMVVMGMVMVFSVLAIIMGVLMIMERFFAGKAKSGEVKKAAPKPAPTVAPAPVVQTVEDDGAVIAAITAAISAILAEENGTETYQGGFRVVSFKRSNRNTPWNSAR